MKLCVSVKLKTLRCAMDDLGAADIKQLYDGALFIRKGQLIRVREVDGRIMTLYNLKSKKTELVPFVMEEYKQLTNRIGMVNIGKSCIFIARNTSRQYLLGPSTSNVTAFTLGVPYPIGKEKTCVMLKNLEAVEVLRAYENDYPDMLTALKTAKEYQGACAFDKQFAVDLNEQVHYKNDHVGSIIDDKLVFLKGQEYLNILLGKGYEKNLGIAKA